MDFVDKLSAFQEMLDLWGKKIKAGRLAMFSHLYNYIEDCETTISEPLKIDIGSHLHSLTKFQFALVRNPFFVKMDDCIPENEDAAQEDFIKLANDSGAKNLFSRVNLTCFGVPYS